MYTALGIALQDAGQLAAFKLKTALELDLICRRSSNKGERELRMAKSLIPADPDVKKALDVIAERKTGKLQR